MANLKGSIKTTENLNGNIKEQHNLNGLIKITHRLLGSVDKFLRSLTIRIFIQPIANIYTSVMVYRNLRATIQPKANVYSTLMAMRNLSDINIIAKSNISITARAVRNMTVNINGSPIFGRETTLELLDNMTLDQMDDLTLEELEFTEGIYVNVIKNAKMNIFGIAEISATVYTIRYRILNDIDELTLDDIDEMTLDELDEIIT